MAKKIFFTSESVSEGHPDKMADQISDAILDSLLSKDQDTHAGIETLVKTGMVLISGEVRTSTWVDIEKIVRKVIIDIGYDKSDLGFDGNSCSFLNCIGQQSADIAFGVDPRSDHEQGAGDQGLMFGYATNETRSFMPAPIHYAHELMRRQAFVRKSGEINYLRPDAKSQVTFVYVGNKIESIDTVVLSTQHEENVDIKTLRRDVEEGIIRSVLPDRWLTNQTKFFINPTGRFVIGGPVGDCGLTGRKIIVDTYGGMARHGGGAFSGKDPSKVDRSAAYAARHVAKNVVAAGLADRCEVQISYAIGIANPTSVHIETFGTEKIDITIIETLVKEQFDLRPSVIIEKFDLKKPIYRKIAAYGHFGRTDVDLSWEKTDQVKSLREAAETFRLE